jgi:serine-type D-Ala-D-Ala endopeptidase (penicillin-binding protein 7)
MKRQLIVTGIMLMIAMSGVNAQTTQKKSANRVVSHHVTKQKLAKAKSSKHTVVSSADTNRIVNRDYRLQSVNYQLDSHEGMPRLASSKALIMRQDTGEVLYGKSTDVPTPIASVTKLMTAMVMLDAYLPMDEYLTVTDDDVDTLKGTSSRLRVGTELTRAEMLHLALMASENRAAHALGRNYPGGVYAFVNAMNTKARMLGMHSTHFVDPTGLNSENVSTAEDLAKMVRAAYQYPQIRQVTTTASQEFAVYGYRNPVTFVNTNALVRSADSDWVIGLSKTGFINEAGRCLVMQVEISGQPLIFVLLDSADKVARIGDAKRIRKWIESGNVNKHVG